MLQILQVYVGTGYGRLFGLLHVVCAIGHEG